MLKLSMMGKISNLFKLRPKRFLGIDIGTSSVRIVELSRKGQAYKLENYGGLETSSFKKRPFRVFEKNTPSLSNKEIAKSIQAIFKETGIQTREVNFSIPDFCSFFTSIKLPAMAEDEVSQAVQYEIRPYIPLPLNEVTLDWSIIEGHSPATPLKILVVAIPNDIISEYREIAQLADLNLRILESEVFALAKSSIKNEEKKKVIGLIDIGARSTTCSIVEEGVLKISHSFNTAGNQLTEIIARSLNIDYNKAEGIKKKYGVISNNGPDESKDVRNILIPLIDSILEEIKKAFRSFYSKEGKEVEKILLSGGLISMPGLKEYFSTELKKEQDIVDPFFNIGCPSILARALKEIGPNYAIATGLAMKGLE